MKKIKSFLFNTLKKVQPVLGSMGINKNTPGAYKTYSFLYELFWPHRNILDIQGSKMFINVNDKAYNMKETFEGYAAHLVHEPATTDLFEKVVRPGDVVLDLGANIGYFTLLAAKNVGPSGKVFSFEPETKNFSYLKKNIELNNYNHVQPNQKAVSNKNGTTKLFICDYDSGHHTINQHEGIEKYSHGRTDKESSIDIETIVLDDYLRDKTNKVDVIKMDVEGAEMLALLGLDQTIKNNSSLKMFIEFFPLLIEEMGSSPKEFIRKLLEDYGFSMFVIPDDYSAERGGMIKIDTVNQVMEMRKGKEDHINLYLEKV